MSTRRERILMLLSHSNGLTDREITDQIDGHSALQQPIHQLCHRMAAQKIIERKIRRDGLIGNYLIHQKDTEPKRVIKNDVPEAGTTASVVQDEEVTQVQAEGLSKLISMGFEHVGDWFLDGQDVSYQLSKFGNERNILYAFIENGQVNYIGKSIQNLNKRMYLYKNCGESQRTNIRVREKIRSSLANGSRVMIYVFIQKVHMTYENIPINLAAGLEDNLIRLISPKWNIR